jgi:hypothetical protein
MSDMISWFLQDKQRTLLAKYKIGQMVSEDMPKKKEISIFSNSSTFDP